ncbi:unnamed protein product [Mytilus edulis]|uniref:Uncharacterized protein n=1 Tax=Mytilus edulis TaxID=6550 RepID=A0A8S3UKD5_MYTED|nr:unnamed protein product [Mytilus edulis]
MVCVVGKGHYMFDSEEYTTVKTLCFNTISPDTYISVIGRRLKTVLITDVKVLCQNVVSPPNTKIMFGEHVCASTKPSAESTSDETPPEYENTSLANTTSSTEGLPAWVSSVISSTIVSLVCSVIGFGVYFIRRRILKKKERQQPTNSPDFELRCRLHAHTPESYELYLERLENPPQDIQQQFIFNASHTCSSESVSSDDLFSSL